METTIKKGILEREKAQEALMVSKLKKELELEQMAYKQQRNTRKKQMRDMISENANAQFLARVAEQKEREEDERIQREIMKKLEEQQNKEANNSKALSKKKQYFVDKMATDVFDKIEMRQRNEEEMIKKYTEEKNMRERIEEQRKLRKQRQELNDMREVLNRQMKDK